MTNSKRTNLNYRVIEHSDVTNYYASAREAAGYRDAANAYRANVGQAGSFLVQSYDWESDEWTTMDPQPKFNARRRVA